MSPRAEREAERFHVDAVRRVESGHVLVLQSENMPELVGELADMREAGWSMAGALAVTMREATERKVDGRGEALEIKYHHPVYTATLVRGLPGSTLGVEVDGSPV